ncbi:MAG TPA: hypothetical protein VI793_12500 [Anaerolineales bacterium]|nr:hypothetical protein [Anaerolineales bacterium]
MDALIKTWEPRLQKAAAVLLRAALGYLFFTQLWWKVPPTFGCPADFKFTTADSNGRLQRTSGLCDWIGVESAWASRPHPVFVSNLDNQGAPEIAVDIGFIARMNGVFLDGFVKPNIRWFGYAVWGMEAFIFVTLFFGILSRLGALVAIAQSAQLWAGLSGINNPFEWEWSYNLFLILSLWAFAFAPGRVFGLDALLRPRLASLTEKGNKLAAVLLWLT